MDYWEQKIVKMFRTVFLILISWSFFGCADVVNNQPQLLYYNEPNFTPLFIKNKAGIKFKINHTIRDFSFVNQDSVTITQEIVEQKIHVANFIFTSCGSICPTMTRNMKIVSDSMENDPDIMFLSYSVTPWIDKPSVLKKFEVNDKISNPNWQFLTGAKSEIYSLARKSYFAEADLGFFKR